MAQERSKDSRSPEMTVTMLSTKTPTSSLPGIVPLEAVWAAEC